MKLTTKGRYAVTTLLDMVLKGRTEPTTISEIAKRHHLSPAYLERLAAKLRQGGLLQSVRGAQGGYLLSKKPEEITIAEIIEVVEENMDTTRCQGQSNCHEGSVCSTHHLWTSLNQVITNFLQQVTLSDLVKRPNSLCSFTELSLPTKVSVSESSQQN